MSFLPGMFPAGVMAASIPTTMVYTDAVHGLAANQASYTVNSLSFGTADATRRVFVAIASATASGVEPSGVTIGGVAATKHVGVSAAGVTSVPCAIWSAAVPTGATGTVFWTVASGDLDGGSVYVFASYNQKVAAAHATNSYASIPAAGDVALDVNVPAGGFVIAIMALGNTFAATFHFSNLTNTPTADGTPTFQNGCAYASSQPAATPLTIAAHYNITPGDSHSNCVSASFV